MSRQHPYSLTLRLALIFALLAFALLATLGVALYRELERELIRRDDAALISRVDQLRNLLNDSNTLDLIKTKPELFQNMLGNRESVLSIAAPGQQPLLLVNPGNIELPSIQPLPKDHRLILSDVQHLPGLNGIPFSLV
ncbi:MAG: two-component sensor histidine kinase, partial [Pseudomonas sp.]|nr:two-component sensor histidine kinase [Pseudomonas sp.]